MDLKLIEQNCAHCGAPVRPGQPTCAGCLKPPVDPVVAELARKIASDEDAIDSILGMGGCPNPAFASLMLHYLSGSDTDLASAAAVALRKTTDRVTLKEMVALLGTRRWLGHPARGNFAQSEHGEHSISAVIRAAFSTPSAVCEDVLVGQLHNVDGSVREAAADLLQYQRGGRVTHGLAETLRHDRDPSVRARAAFALGEIGDSGSVDLLVEALYDESSLVQSKAAHALGRYGTGIVPTAGSLLASGSPQVALHSARLLGEIKSPEAIHALIGALRSVHGMTRLFAEQAILQIGRGAVPALLDTLVRHSDLAVLRDGILYVLRHMSMSDAERAILQPVIAAAERLNAAIETPGAAYVALGKIQNLTADEHKALLDDI